MPKVEDLTGRRFGRLVVINRAQNDKHKKTRWVCRCDCGNITIVGRAELRTGDTQSCGCLHLERIAENNKKHKTTHGLSNTRISVIWKDMIERCEKPNSTSYKNYGARGIKVCETWHDLEVFANWAYANGYDDAQPRGQCTIERIDLNGDYTPDNCKFVDMFEQNCNRRVTTMVEYKGESIALMRIARQFGISGKEYKKLWKLVKNKKMKVEDALSCCGISVEQQKEICNGRQRIPLI